MYKKISSPFFVRFQKIKPKQFYMSKFRFNIYFINKIIRILKKKIFYRKNFFFFIFLLRFFSILFIFFFFIFILGGQGTFFFFKSVELKRTTGKKKTK
jgi:hypothetical protein